MKILVSNLFIFTVLAIITQVIATSCKKDETAYSIIQGGKLEGTITGISNGDIDFIKAHTNTGFIVGGDSISTKDFSILLIDPPVQYLINENSGLGIYTNDTTIKGCMLNIDCYKNNVKVGHLERLNSYTASSDTALGTPMKGNATSSFMYLNKRFIEIAEVDQQYNFPVTIEYKISIRATLNKGWNEMVSICTNSAAQPYTYSQSANNEPAEMKWYLIPY